ncbi:helix-turn-helix domain-containing protein [Sphingomonas sp. AP4-R1]|uniref:IclR family transcriptional regulator n=1 Tax=Sphingomonas sp. AP4-R1 TaxID=2735134 RepID=UPI0014939572|nr:helix-turn-helix domain-containing protein [Sphingomonas sp. AP4-R1]QJU58178.1 helix-turn-helix domain-containing protein [Sphingomonas sp. AP4-R1]
MFSDSYERNELRRRSIGSVETGILVLQAIVDLRRAASLKEIAANAKLEASQTHRYLSALVNSGMVKQTEAGLYDLGYTSIRTGLAALSRLPMLSIADEIARTLTTETGATTHVTVWGMHGPTIIRWNQGSPPVYTALSLGSSLPVTRSSTGRTFMAYMHDDALAPFLKAEGLGIPIEEDPKLQAARDEIRRTRISSFEEALVVGFPAYASPILAPRAAITAVVTAVMPEVLARERSAEIKAKLVKLCKAACVDFE